MSTSESAVSRRFVTATRTALAELLAADLSGLDLVAFMVDGVHFAESCCVVALTDHPGRHEGPAVAGRGLDKEHDTGHRADRRSAGARVGCHPADAGGPGRQQSAAPGGAGVFDAPVLARCQLHKIRNVRDKLGQRLRPIVGRRMCAAYHAETALQAQSLLTELARELDTTHPSAAASLREGCPRP